MKPQVNIFFVFIFCAVKLCAQDSSKLLEIKALPSIFHTPETSWGFGATILAYYKPNDSLTKKSNSQLFLDYTLMHQASLQTDWNIFTKANRFFIDASTDLSKFPEFYFGVGNANNPLDRTLIHISYGDIKFAILRQTKAPLYVGCHLHSQTLYSTDKTITHNGIEINEMGYSAAGAGITLLVDKRNDILCPSNGYFAQNAITKYLDLTHDTKGYISNTLDLRYYKSFKNDFVLNSALYSANGFGTIPFRMMPYLGGARYMRGYYAGRFRDNHMSTFQVEMRKHLFWRIGIAGFGGFGQVYENVREFNVNRFHYNYGAGLRFRVDKETPANIRLDIGKTKDSYGVYIVFAEAF